MGSDNPEKNIDESYWRIKTKTSTECAAAVEKNTCFKNKTYQYHIAFSSVSAVWPYLESCAEFWSLDLTKDITELEKEPPMGLEHLLFNNSLKHRSLFSLQKRETKASGWIQMHLKVLWYYRSCFYLQRLLRQSHQRDESFQTTEMSVSTFTKLSGKQRSWGRESKREIKFMKHRRSPAHKTNQNKCAIFLYLLPCPFYTSWLSYKLNMDEGR